MSILDNEFVNYAVLALVALLPYFIYQLYKKKFSRPPFLNPDLRIDLSDWQTAEAVLLRFETVKEDSTEAKIKGFLAERDMMFAAFHIKPVRGVVQYIEAKSNNPIITTVKLGTKPLNIGDKFNIKYNPTDSREIILEE